MANTNNTNRKTGSKKPAPKFSVKGMTGPSRSGGSMTDAQRRATTTKKQQAALNKQAVTNKANQLGSARYGNTPMAAINAAQHDKIERDLNRLMRKYGYGSVTFNQKGRAKVR